MSSGAGGSVDGVHPLWGSFTLSFKGQTTRPLSFDATSAEIESALIALPSIGGVSVEHVIAGSAIDSLEHNFHPNSTALFDYWMVVFDGRCSHEVFAFAFRFPLLFLNFRSFSSSPPPSSRCMLAQFSKIPKHIDTHTHLPLVSSLRFQPISSFFCKSSHARMCLFRLVQKLDWTRCPESIGDEPLVVADASGLQFSRSPYIRQARPSVGVIETTPGRQVLQQTRKTSFDKLAYVSSFVKSYKHQCF